MISVHFFEWFRNQEDFENEQKSIKRDWDYRDPALECVRKAALSMLDDAEEIKVRRNPLRMVVIRNDKEYRVDQLSDGEKVYASLAGRHCSPRGNGETPAVRTRWRERASY